MNNSANNPKIQLTSSGIHSLVEDQKTGIIVQILSADILPGKPGADSLKYKVVISDGFAKHKAVFGNRAASIFHKAGAPSFSIVRIDEVTIPKAILPKKLLIITELHILYNNIKNLIGFPIEYQEWVQQASLYANITKSHEKKCEDSKSIPIEIEESPIEQVDNRSENSIRENSIRENSMRENSIRENSLFDIIELKKSSVNKSSSPQKKFSPLQKWEQLTTTAPNSTARERDYNVSESSPTSIFPAIKFRTYLEPNNHLEEFNPKSVRKNEVDILEQKAARQISGFPLFGVQFRDFEDCDEQKLNQAKNSGKAFSADFFDKEGNKITAVFFGEQANTFLSLFETTNTHILTNLNTKTSL